MGFNIRLFKMSYCLYHVLFYSNNCILYFIMTCYAGGISSIPTYIGDAVGTKQLGEFIVRYLMLVQ